MAEPRYRISTVAKLSGLSTHAIRVWERRYEALSPERSAGGARLYSDAEVSRLRLLKRAVDRGHPIGQVVSLDDAALRKLAGAPSEQPLSSDSSQHAELVAEVVDAARSLDALRVKALLDRAEARLSPRALVQQVFVPLLSAVGDAWARGEVCTAGEHLTSVLVRERAAAIFRRYPQEPGRPTVLVTTPAGELHELGAILAAATFAMHGAGLVYLGPNLPASEIALAARAVRAGIVALSVVSLEPAAAVQELAALAGELPREVALVVGGSRASHLSQLVDPRVVLLSNLAELERWFERS